MLTKLLALLCASILAIVPASRERPGGEPSPSAVGSAPGEAPSPRQGSRPLLPPVMVRVTGVVDGMPAGADVAVTVNVGGTPVAARVSGRSYDAEIVAPLDAMLSVEATAPGIRFQSLLGSAARVARRGGADAHAVVAEHEALRVSPWSTRVAIVSARSQGGRPIASDDELDRARFVLATPVAWVTSDAQRTVNDVAVTAALLDAYASGTPLPAGTSTGYQAVSDPSILDSDLATLQEAAAADGALDWGHAAPLSSLSDVPGTLVLASRMLQGEHFNAPRHVMMVTPAATGRVRVDFGPFGVDTPLFAPTLPGTAVPEFDASITADGDLRLVPSSPLVWRFHDEQVSRIDVASIVLRRIAAGGVDLWSVTMDWHQSSDLRPDLAPVPRRQWGLMWGASLAEIARPVAWGVAGSRMTLPSFCLRPATAGGNGHAYSLCEHAQYRLDGGGRGLVQDAGPKLDAYLQPRSGVPGDDFSWSLRPDGRSVRIDTPSGSLETWVIGRQDAGADIVLHRASATSGTPAGQVVVGIGLAVRGDIQGFDAVTAAGHWFHPPLLGVATRAALPAPSIERQAGGRFLDRGFIGEAAGPVSGAWRLFDGRVYDIWSRARFADGARYVATCQQAFAQGAYECAPTHIRYFKPILRVGNRLYGHTELYTQWLLRPNGYNGTFAQVERVPGAVTYFDCGEGPCRPAPATSASSPGRAASVPGDRPRLRSTTSDHAHLRLRMRRLRPQL